MDRALFAAASGMAAQQRNLDTIADNLANAGVVGFKGSAQHFAELIASGEGGLGTVALGPQIMFAQGKLARSAGPFDLAIDGAGFFTVVDGGGGIFTRATVSFPVPPTARYATATICAWPACKSRKTH